MPYLGGFYLRYLPFFVIQNQLKTADQNSALWTYVHPYDFDFEEKNWKIKGASAPVSLLLWFNRKNTFKKLDRLLSACTVLPPFKEQTFKDNLKIIDPATL